MKATFKKAITGILAAAMCAVPMVSAMSASAAPSKIALQTEFQRKTDGEITKEIVAAFADELKIYDTSAPVKIKITPSPIAVAGIKKGTVAYPDPENPDKDWGPLTPFVREEIRIRSVAEIDYQLMKEIYGGCYIH